MREASFTFDDGFKGGLRRLKSNPANSQAFVEAYNVRVGLGGMEAYEPLVQPIVSPPAIVWPYPQMFLTRNLGLMVVSRTNFYSVDGSYALSSQLAVSSRNQRWTLADFGTYLVAANGAAPIERYITPLDAVAWRVAPVAYTVNAVCNYKGQLFGAGFGGALNTAAWSRIGRVDITTLLSLGTDDKTVSSGTKVMEWDGEGYWCERLGDAVVVYGSGGISVFPEKQEPVPTFGYETLNSVGLAGRYCVAGDDKRHLWVDKSGFVWMMRGDLKPKLLGYQEYMLPMLDGTIVVSFDAAMEDWYISDGTTTYLCNERGMTSVYQHPVGAVAYGGGLIGIANESKMQYAEIATDRFDLQNRDIKTVSVIEADVDTQDVFAAIDYKFASNDEWRSSRFKQFNKHGFVTPMMSGVELRFRMRWTDFSKFAISHFIARYKQVDKRSIRGTYVLPSNRGVTV